MSKIKSTSPKKLEKKKLQKLKDKYQDQLNAVFAESDAVESASGNGSIQMRVAELEAALTSAAPTIAPDQVNEEIRRLVELQTAILNNAAYGVISTTTDGIITSFNPAAERMLQYKAKELIGKVTPAAFHDENEVVARAKTFSAELGITLQPGFEVFVAKARHDLPNEHEWTYIRKDGTRLPVLLSVTALRDSHNEIIGFLGIANDITERKRAEKFLVQASALDAAGNAVVITDPNGIVEFINPAFTQITGYTVEDIVGKKNNLLKSGKHNDQFYTQMWQTILNGKTWRGEVINRRKDGTLYNEDQTITPVFDDHGKISHFISIKQDITERKQIETRLLDAIEHIDSGFVMYGPDERLIVCNTRYKELYPKSAHLMIPGTAYEDILHESYRQGNYTHTDLNEDEWVASRLALHRATQERNSYELQVGQRWIRIDDARASDGGIVSLRTDITASKQAEEELRESESNLAEALRLAKLANWEFDFINSQFIFNDAFYALFHTTAEREGGYRLTPEQYSQRFVHPQDIPIVVESIERVMASRELHQSIVVEHRILYADGGIGFIAARINVDKDDQGNLLRYYGANQDITDRKEAEESLRTSETNLAEALRTARLGNWEYDFLKDEFTFNEGFYTVMRTTAEREGGYKMNAARYTERFVYPEDAPLVGIEIGKSIETTDPNFSTQVDHRVIFGDGQIGYVSVRFHIEKNAEGRTIKSFGANQDITERKQAEEALRTSEANLAEALRIARLGNWEYDFAKDQFTFNDDFYAMMRTTAEREGGYTMNAARYTERFVYPEDAPLVGVEIGKAIETTDPNFSTQVDHRVIFGDGQIGYVNVSFRIEKNAEGRTIKSFGANQDITERQQTQALITKRAAELQAVAEISTAASIATNTQEMLQNVVDMTKKGFGFYHAHIYLLDETNANLILTAGAGEIGKQMVSAERSIPLNHPHSLVARAARTRSGAIANDITKEKDFLPNPLLPNTRSELATPILVGNTVLGVFDVQADIPDRFNQEDIAIETTLARQIGAALQNVRSLEQAERTLAELDRLNRRLVREGWQDYQERGKLGGQYVYQLPQAIKTGSTEPLLKAANKKITAPLAVRGEVIGELEITDSIEAEEKQDIIHAIAERLSAQIENLRLNEQTQVALAETSKRAIEVQAVSEVTTAASTILERDQLLEKAVTLTQRRFNLYHCHVFLYDSVTHNLSINACGWREGDPHEGTHGKRIIPLTQEKSLVAQAARDRQPVIANDVTKSANWLANELLPETRAEVAIPMTVGDTLIGVFDVQSEKVDRFSEEDVRTFSTLASAVAVATQNANLYAEQTATVARLKDVDQLKSSFLANMSHELRTPLNSVIGFTEVLLEGIDGDLTEPMENDLKVIHKNGQHLLNLINDVLDMAKIEAGRMTLTIEEFNLQEVIEEVAQITRPLADAKSIELRLDININEDLTLEADRIRMRQVMINVVNNSIKFTETGYVAINAKRTTELIKVTVTDTGVGIPLDHLDKIFQEFTQVDTSTTRKAGGTGLGLPISRHLVDLHGGRLWAESTGIPGEGSVFHIELPIIAKRVVE